MQASSRYTPQRVLAIVALLLASGAPASSQQAEVKPSAAASPASTSPADDRRSAKQRLLDDEAQRLVTMATELKVEVDKTNKNILSLHVVRKAEEIEALARKMKDQEKR